MADEELQWPFGSTDGGPASRPTIVNLENVLVLVLPDTATGEQVLAELRQRGLHEQRLRLYTGEQIVAYDAAFKSGRGVKERVVGKFVDDTESMDAYVQYGREGCSALWIQLDQREEANSLIRGLIDHDVLFAWFHGGRGFETVRFR